MSILRSIFSSPFGGTGDGLPYQQFGSDSFTDTNGTLITAHTNDAGVVWTPQTGFTITNHALIHNNRLFSQSSLNVYTSNFAPASADYEVYGKFLKLSGGGGGITGRASISANTYYALRYDGTQWGILRSLAGTATVIGTQYVDVWADSTEKEVVLQMVGSTIKGFIDGVERISVVDANITGAGVGGVRMGLASTSTTGVHLDTYQVRGITL